MTRAPQGERWRLHAITIGYFRGVAGEHTVLFDGVSGLLHGKNGVGKSTVAQCLQWALYGRFPQSVLANAWLPRFLAPVEGRKKAYCGEVTFQRGAERLMLRRDQADGSFTVKIGSRCYDGKEAEAKRDELLGLDMDTFVRAVLLQQSRIRGLLLDEPQERNMALDRLLGMDALEQLVSVVRSGEFVDAARDWRSSMRADEEALRAEADVLRKQREEAEGNARAQGFKAKDFNRLGLQQAYAAVAASLEGAAKKHGVAFDALPPCDTPAKVSATHKRVMRAIQNIRNNSRLTRQREPVRSRLAKLSQLQEMWKDALELRDREDSPVKAWVEKYGEKEAVVDTQGKLQEQLDKLKKELADADALHQILRDTHAYVEHRDVGSCPVCEQPLPRGMNLRAALAKRMKTLASKDLDRLTAAVGAHERKLEKLGEQLKQRNDLDDALSSAQRQVDRARRAVEKALEINEIAETKVTKRIADALGKLEGEEAAITERIEEMEGELTAIQERSQEILDSLVPVVQKREEQIAHEAEQEKRRNARADEIQNASRMDRLAVQLDTIRSALLRAKHDIASENLNRAGPRADAIYRKLVRHPRFDTLRLTTQPRKNKIDYAFEVSVDGASKLALEARLALSDGQLTAAALSVFFALAECTAHGLDLLFVDDPTQNLDLPCKEAMAKVIAEIAKRKQVIVATHDEDFVGMLHDQDFNTGAYIHHLVEWDGNPKYVTTPPRVGAPRLARGTAK